MVRTRARSRISPAVLTGRGLVGVAVAALIAAPWLFDVNGLQLATELLSTLVLAVMWNLLAGYADIITIGQQAFVGVGAYAFYGFAVFSGVNPYLAILLGGVASFVVAIPSMVVIFRLRAAYLSVGTWVVAETLMLGAGKLNAFGAGSGISMPVSVVQIFGDDPVSRTRTIYWLAFALAAVAFVTTYALMRSRIGLGLTAMRDNEEGSGAVGVDLVRSRLICFLWTAPFLGLAGAIITLQELRVEPDQSFSLIDWTVYIIFMVVIGGVGSFEGPIIGTLVFFLIREYLQNWGVWHFIVLGIVSIAVILIEPRGIWGMLRRVIPDDIIPVGHRPRGLLGGARYGMQPSEGATAGTEAVSENSIGNHEPPSVI